MKLSFIIVNYRSEKYLGKCLSSINEKVLGMDYEIIIVNNDPANIEAELLSGIKLINKGENIGFGAGCNAGAKVAQGEILSFLNPDTEIISENIKDFLAEFEKDEKLAVIGPKLVNEEGDVQEWIAGKEVTIPSIILNNLGHKRDKKIWESEKLIERAWVSGAAIFVRKDIFNRIGGFDEKFFMYFEDVDLCKRAKLASFKVSYFPNFVIKHFGSRSFLGKKEQKKYYYTSQFKYFKKYLTKQIKTG